MNKEIIERHKNVKLFFLRSLECNVEAVYNSIVPVFYLLVEWLNLASTKTPSKAVITQNWVIHQWKSIRKHILKHHNLKFPKHQKEKRKIALKIRNIALKPDKMGNFGKTIMVALKANKINRKTTKLKMKG